MLNKKFYIKTDTFLYFNQMCTKRLEIGFLRYIGIGIHGIYINEHWEVIVLCYRLLL